MNYSFFLFTKLFDVIISVNYEYDYLFENLQWLYYQYDQSKYNNGNKGEYECMVEFLISNKNWILPMFLEFQKEREVIC